jgi:hypothetical protein
MDRNSQAFEGEIQEAQKHAEGRINVTYLMTPLIIAVVRRRCI